MFVVSTVVRQPPPQLPAPLMASVDPSWNEGLPAGFPPPGSPEDWPRLTVVTPSFNQGSYLEETIRSVLGQGYPHLEYIIMDGGSTDQSRAIMEHYAPWLTHWESVSDRGQAHAINKGFALATGDYVAWQNADDTYRPGALAAVAAAVRDHRGVDVVYGTKDYVDASGRFLFAANTLPPTPANMVPWPCFHSEVTFIKRAKLMARNGVDESFHHYLDYDLFWDLVLDNCHFAHAPAMRSTFRQHPAAKSSRQADIAQAEAFRIYRRIHDDPRLPPAVRPALVEAMRNECLNDWGHYRFEKLRAHLNDLRQCSGFAALTPKLVGLALASWAGESFVRKLKRPQRRPAALAKSP